MIEKKTAINNNHQKKKKEKLTMLAVRKGERLRRAGACVYVVRISELLHSIWSKQVSSSWAQCS